MANKLAAVFKLEREVEVAHNFNMDEVEVEVEMVPQEEMFVLEEDPEMYAAAGLPIPNISKPVDVDAVIKNVMSSVPDMKGANVTYKIVVVTGNNSTMNF